MVSLQVRWRLRSKPCLCREMPSGCSFSRQGSTSSHLRVSEKRNLGRIQASGLRGRLSVNHDESLQLSLPNCRDGLYSVRGLRLLSEH